MSTTKTITNGKIRVTLEGGGTSTITIPALSAEVKADTSGDKFNTAINGIAAVFADDDNHSITAAALSEVTTSTIGDIASVANVNAAE